MVYFSGLNHILVRTHGYANLLFLKKKFMRLQSTTVFLENDLSCNDKKNKNGL